MVFGLILLTVCVIYAGAFLLGWYLATHGRLNLSLLVQHRRTFSDPFTRRLQRWCQAEKLNAIRRHQWRRLWLLIVANNLGAVALVGRTLYGTALVPAVYLTYRQGLSQGVFVAHSSPRPRGVLLLLWILEFGAYLIATALGANLVLTPLLGGTFRGALESLAVFYPVVASSLLVGAWLEVTALRSKMPSGFQIPEGLDMDELRKKAFDVIGRPRSDTDSRG